MFGTGTGMTSAVLLVILNLSVPFSETGSSKKAVSLLISCILNGLAALPLGFPRDLVVSFLLSLFPPPAFFTSLGLPFFLAP